MKKTIIYIAVSILTAMTGVSSCEAEESIQNPSSEETAVTSLQLDQIAMTLSAGSSETLTATVLPENASDRTVTWTSSDESVATVSAGVVKGIAAGTATVTAAAGGKTASCKITVEENAVEEEEEVEDADAGPYSQSSGDHAATGKTFTSTESDENAVKVSGGSFTMTDCTVEKTDGKTADSDGSSFYGTNAAILSTGSGSVTMKGGTITTATTGANAVVAYKGTVYISDVKIDCSSNLSRGIHATGGGSIVASDLEITTAGNNSSLIATDRGSGTVTVTGGTYHATGGSSAVIYSTGDITATGITGSSAKGSMCVIEGDNTITMTDCDLTSGGTSRGILILQSGSGDATGYNGTVTATGGSLKVTSDVPFIEVATTMTGTVNLTDVDVSAASGILMRVDYNTRWKTKNPVAFLNLLSASSHSYSGDIEVDGYGTATVMVGKGVTWNGAFDSADTGKATEVTVKGTWTLTDDSHVDKITIESGGVIKRNGHTLEYGSKSGSGTIE